MKQPLLCSCNSGALDGREAVVFRLPKYSRCFALVSSLAPVLTNIETKGNLMMKKWLVAMLGAAAMTASAAALAQQSRLSGWYVGGEVGNAEIGSEDDTSFKILGGYQINRNFAAEVGYGMLLDKGGVEVTAMELVGVGSFPLGNQFSVFGKLGFANVEAEFAGLSADDTELTYAIGVQYDLNRNLGIRGQWQRYDTENEVDVLSVGIVYRF